MTALAGAVMIGGALALLATGLVHRPVRRDLAEEIGMRPPGMPRPFPLASAARRVGRSSAASWLARDAGRAGIRRSPGELAVLVAAGAAGALMLAGLAAGAVTGIVAAVSVVAGARAAIRRRARRRIDRFDDALPDALDLLAGSLEAGSSLAQAMEIVAAEGSPPLSDELARILSENRLGEPIAGAMEAAAARIGSRDFTWVVRGVRAQHDHGASLAGLLRVAAEFMRARREMHADVRALTAEGRISAAILIALPFAVAGFFWLANPGYLRTLTGSATGWGILGTAAVLLTGGAIWLRRIVKVEV